MVAYIELCIAWLLSNHTLYILYNPRHRLMLLVKFRDIGLGSQEYNCRDKGLGSQECITVEIKA